MPTFRKKPVEIQAFQLPSDSENFTPFLDWAGEVGFADWKRGETGGILIPTLEGEMNASPGDFIIKGVQGEFYPCKPDIFEQTYDLVA